MRYARLFIVLVGVAMVLSLGALGIYTAYLTKLWYQASANW